MRRLCGAALVVLLGACDGRVGGPVEEDDGGLVLEEDAGTDAGTVATPDAGTTPDAGATPDAGVATPDAGVATPDAGTTPDAGVATVPVLIAQGRFGRTVVSCDDGRTWVNDRDEAQGARCSDASVDCFHHPWAPMGIVQAGRAVVATWGWGGTPGRVRRTVDGITWQDVISSSIFSDIAWGNGRVLLGGGPVQSSTFDGALGTWVPGGSPMTVGGVLRHTAFAGRFMLTQDERIHLSDDGAQWRVPSSPAGCAGPSMGLLTHGNTALVVQYSGRVCVSTDAGDTWQLVNVASSLTGRGVWANGAFWLWSGATRYRSTDGLTWTSASGSPADLAVGAVAFTAAGTFVAFKGGWQSEYQNERVWRSADGLNWVTVPASDHPHSHPITSLVAAEVQASSVCR